MSPLCGRSRRYKSNYKGTSLYGHRPRRQQRVRSTYYSSASGQDGNESVQSSLSSASDCNATQDAVQSGEFAGSALANPVDECWPVDARLRSEEHTSEL